MGPKPFTFLLVSPQDFQPTLRELVPGLPTWEERLADTSGIGQRRIHYELGYPGVTDDRLTRHEDVLY